MVDVVYYRPVSESSEFIHLTKTSASVQNIGGGNGTTNVITWDSALHDSDIFLHDPTTNNSRIVISEAGRYSIMSHVGWNQLGGGRTTIALFYRINGINDIIRGKGRNYSRGSIYGDGSTNINTEYDFEAGDYIEIISIVDDSDSTAYVVSTFAEECELIIRKMR